MGIVVCNAALTKIDATGWDHFDQRSIMEDVYTSCAKKIKVMEKPHEELPEKLVTGNLFRGQGDIPVEIQSSFNI